MIPFQICFQEEKRAYKLSSSAEKGLFLEKSVLGF